MSDEMPPRRPRPGGMWWTEPPAPTPGHEQQYHTYRARLAHNLAEAQEALARADAADSWAARDASLGVAWRAFEACAEAACNAAFHAQELAREEEEHARAVADSWRGGEEETK